MAGLVIGTRPDCINGELLDRLAVMARDYFVMIEYGIESVNDDILRRINRGHDFTTAMKALKETELRGLNAGAHLIFGLPGESRTVSVRVDREALKDIADTTQGRAFSAATEGELRDVYADIGSSVGYTTEEREVSSWFIGGALALLLITSGMSLVWFSRLP